MIVVEGVDGSGKSSLVARLCHDLQIPLHARASDSVEGPVKNLWRWAWDDVIHWEDQELSIYDRHPLVSEYIYGPITRGSMDPMFVGVESQSLYRVFRENCIIIFCDPDLEDIGRNVIKQPQMNGVLNNFNQLYWAYRAYFHLYSGFQIRWDYNETDYASLLANLKFWKENRD